MTVSAHRKPSRLTLGRHVTNLASGIVLMFSFVDGLGPPAFGRADAAMQGTFGGVNANAASPSPRADSSVYRPEAPEDTIERGDSCISIAGHRAYGRYCAMAAELGLVHLGRLSQKGSFLLHLFGPPWLGWVPRRQSRARAPCQ